MKDFRKLEIWVEGMEIAKTVYLMSLEIPSEMNYGLADQLRRSARSIPANIAEGASRSSQIDFKRFLEIALGSANELETDLILLRSIRVLDDKETETLIDRIKGLEQRINSLIQKIKRDQAKAKSK